MARVGVSEGRAEQKKPLTTVFNWTCFKTICFRQTENGLDADRTRQNALCVPIAGFHLIYRFRPVFFFFFVYSYCGFFCSRLSFARHSFVQSLISKIEHWVEIDSTILSLHLHLPRCCVLYFRFVVICVSLAWTMKKKVTWNTHSKCDGSIFQCSALDALHSFSPQCIIIKTKLTELCVSSRRRWW